MQKNQRWGEKVLFSSSQTAKLSKILLISCILACFLPFMNSRFSRTAGDDKVYVAQAIEMESRGDWFVQTLADEPDYRKGVVHYFFLRVGFLLFGKNMFSTVYMNLLLILIAALCLASLAERHLPKGKGWDFWIALGFALNAGIYSHAFASQMEVELAAIFAIALYLLDRSKSPLDDLWFWLIAGLVGAVKAPIHSVMLGFTAIMFWAWRGSLIYRLKDYRYYLAVFAGIFFCILTYLPALIVDYDNFVNTYLGRENFEKGSNGAPWHYPIIPLFTYSLFPWMFAALVAYADGFWRLIKREPFSKDRASFRLIQLGISLMLPSIVFFLFHPYRGQNYNLPVISGLLLVIAAIWSTRKASWTKAYQAAMVLTGLIVISLPIAITVVVNHFKPMPIWWSPIVLPVLWVGCLFTAKSYWVESLRFQLQRPDHLARNSIWFFIAVSVFMVVIGEREMIDVRHQIDHAKANNENAQLSYYNLHRNVWSEWGYLNCMIPADVSGMHTKEDIHRSIAAKKLLLVPGEERLDELKSFLAANYPFSKIEINLWRRWKTKGKNKEGIPVWKDAWKQKDLSKIEKEYYIVRVKTDS